MVRDGYIYALSLLAVAAALAWLTGAWAWGIAPVLLAAFFLWFFRDPRRTIPSGIGLIVSPADGLVTETATIATPEGALQRISIFLSVFDVHVNRAPISGTVSRVHYQKGRFLNAMNPASAERNEQSVVTLRGAGADSGFEITSSKLRACWRGASSAVAPRARPWSVGNAWGSSNSAQGSMFCCRQTPSCGSR